MKLVSVSYHAGATHYKVRLHVESALTNTNGNGNKAEVPGRTTGGFMEVVAFELCLQA